METTMILILGLSVATFAFTYLVMALRRRQQENLRREKELRRTIDKLRAKNGHLWFQLITSQKNPERGDLTQTNITR